MGNSNDVPKKWSRPSAEIINAKHTWYPQSELKVKRYVSKDGKFEQFKDGARFNKNASYVTQPMSVYSLSFHEGYGYELDMYANPPKGGTWEVNHTLIKWLGSSEDGLYVKLNIKTENRRGDILTDKDHIFWRYRYF